MPRDRIKCARYVVFVIYDNLKQELSWLHFANHLRKPDFLVSKAAETGALSINAYAICQSSRTQVIKCESSRTLTRHDI